MKRTIAVLLYTVVFIIAGCGKDDTATSPSSSAPSYPSGTATGTATGADAGTVTGTAAVSAAGYAGTAVTGTVTVILDDIVLSIPISGSSVSADSTITVAFTFTGMAAGRKRIVYLAQLGNNGTSAVSAGYSYAVITAGSSTTIAGNVFQTMEIESGYTPVTAPSFNSISTLDSVTTSPYLTLSGRVVDMDLSAVFIMVNDNCFITSVNPYNGSDDFSQSITLVPGMNEIYVLALNSAGLAGSSGIQTIRYDVPAGSNGIMLATLVWDTPTSDMDLHCFYYTATSPDLAIAADEQCYYSYDNLSISPTPNLDVDDTEGDGPEHITFTSFPDGYYVFVVNSYDLDEDLHATCIVTLNTGTGSEQSTVRTFVTSNDEDYNDPAGWHRCFDVRVTGGIPQVLTPSPAFVLQEGVLSKSAVRSAKKK